MQYKITGNKRGVGIDEGISLLILIIAATIIYALLSMANSSFKNSIVNDLAFEKSKNEISTDLNAFLKMHSSGISNSDQLVSDYLAKDFSKTESSLNNFFGSNPKYNTRWIAIIKGKNAQKRIGSMRYSGLIEDEATSVFNARATAYLPVPPKGEDTITISITLVRGK